MAEAQHPRGFASDNFAGAHPEVLGAIARANTGHAPAYGDDPWTAAAEARFREHFGDQARAFFVFGGTAANVLAIDAVARRGDAAVCAATAHLHVDEAGAPERIAGVKLLAVPTDHGKLMPEDLGRWQARRGDQHHVQPRVVSISQATELGTVYSIEETTALAAAAHDREMLLHVDGARLANAAAALDAGLAELTTAAGVDLISFGGTKNGLLFGEAVIFGRPELAERFAFVRKQGMQLASKMRFVSAQLDALLSDELWLRNAAHANAMARRLAEAVAPHVELTHPVEANAVFARPRQGVAERLLAELPPTLPFHVWDPDRGEVRWMCSWDTTPEDVDAFAAALAAAS